MDLLKSWRADSEERFRDVFNKAQDTCDREGVVLQQPRCPSRSVNRGNAGTKGDAEAYYRVNVYIPLLDSTIQQLDARFSDQHTDSLSLCRLIPAFRGTSENVKPGLKKYERFLDLPSAVLAALQLWTQMWKEEEKRSLPSTAVSALDCCPRVMLPNIFTLLQILATLPVSTAEPERVFSRVTQTMTALRASVAEYRLEALIFIQIYRDCPAIAVNPVLDYFCRKSSRRLRLTL